MEKYIITKDNRMGEILDQIHKALYVRWENGKKEAYFPTNEDNIIKRKGT